MMDRLPEMIDPLVFAERRTDLVGKFELDGFKRLAELLIDVVGQVEIELSFSKQGRNALIDGWAEATLGMQCQNCLQRVDVPIQAIIRLGVITVLEQADRLPEGYEPLMVTAEKMSLKEIIEDELLLTLPTFPKHELQCVDFKNHSSGLLDDSMQDEQAKPNNPFAVLAKFN